MDGKGFRILAAGHGAVKGPGLSKNTCPKVLDPENIDAWTRLL